MEQTDKIPLICWVSGRAGPLCYNYDIFEGTEQIQQLVIARALSGMRIE